MQIGAIATLGKISYELFLFMQVYKLRSQEACLVPTKRRAVCFNLECNKLNQELRVKRYDIQQTHFR